MKRVAILYGVCLLALLFASDSGWLKSLGDIVHTVPFLDKVLHFGMYGVLAFLTISALARNRNRSLIRAMVTGSAIVIVASTVDEVSNLFMFYRDWSLGDLAANYLGVFCLGVLPAWTLGRRPRLADRPGFVAEVLPEPAANVAAEPQNATSC